MSYNDVSSIDPGPNGTSLKTYDKALEVNLTMLLLSQTKACHYII